MFQSLKIFRSSATHRKLVYKDTPILSCFLTPIDAAPLHKSLYNCTSHTALSFANKPAQMHTTLDTRNQ